MESSKLSFCKINKVSESIAEIIVYDGIEVDLKMVEEYHKWISENLSTPCALLVNKINKYTYTFEAQINLIDLPQIKAIAVITYNRISELTTATLTKLPRKTKWNLKMFYTKEDGLEWLESELQK